MANNIKVVRGLKQKPARQAMGRGKGRGPDRSSRGFGMGSRGHCVCPKCGTKVPQTSGEGNSSYKCPKCGNPMSKGE